MGIGRCGASEIRGERRGGRGRRRRGRGRGRRRRRRRRRGGRGREKGRMSGGVDDDGGRG